MHSLCIYKTVCTVSVYIARQKKTPICVLQNIGFKMARTAFSIVLHNGIEYFEDDDFVLTEKEFNFPITRPIFRS